jgi:anhydro-N-acetylmuramic acid kinase
LLGDYEFFLNLGGIANISFNTNPYIAFDICPANRVLNALVANSGKEFDDGGQMARGGKIIPALLEKLNALDYYKQSYPKSLANDFGTDVVYPLIRKSGAEVTDGLRTYVEHIVIQIYEAIKNAQPSMLNDQRSMLVTGGGAFNHFMIERLKDKLKELNIETVIPGENLVKYKEAMIMAFIAVLRWRQEYNVLSSVTGATRNSIGGALWIGQEA